MTTSAASAITEAVSVIEHWLDQDIDELISRKTGSPQETVPLLLEFISEHHGYLPEIIAELDDLKKLADRLGTAALQKLGQEGVVGTDTGVRCGEIYEEVERLSSAVTLRRLELLRAEIDSRFSLGGLYPLAQLILKGIQTPDEVKKKYKSWLFGTGKTAVGLVPGLDIASKIVDVFSSAKEYFDIPSTAEYIKASLVCSHAFLTFAAAATIFTKEELNELIRMRKETLERSRDAEREGISKWHQRLASMEQEMK
jgi:hypothetical protein